MVRNIEFKTGQNDKIQSSKNVLAFANKTTNLYEMSPDQYNSLLKNSITKTYKKLTSLRKPELIKKLEISKTFEIRQQN